MPNYDVMRQASQIARRYALKKPEDINVTNTDWSMASPETKSLLIQVRELEKPLEDTYWQAVESENWRRALFLYQRCIHMPLLFSLSRVIHTEKECQQHEAEYIAQAKEWIAEAEELLGSG